MPTPERIYHGSVRALSVVMVGVGVALLIVTLSAGGGGLSLGVLMGAVFIAVGAGRLWADVRLRR